MRITSQPQLDTTVQAAGTVAANTVQPSNISPRIDQSLELLMTNQQQTSVEEKPTKETYLKAVNALNKFMELHNRSSKFVFHDGLDRYYVQVVDSSTDEVVREIPPKKLLDAYYSMQKFLGKVVDETI
ncbi:flagellar protein FlaG [Viridibacillus arvi]|uniref:flagellar protein FlaG n=1 Tax=Viridibacillus arvi TaxID=263475 RepID=UPI0036A5D30D